MVKYSRIPGLFELVFVKSDLKKALDSSLNKFLFDSQ